MTTTASRLRTPFANSLSTRLTLFGIVGFAAAAFVAGVLAGRGTTFATRWLAAIAGIAVIYFGGMAQLVLLTGSVSRAVQVGIAPFALLDLAKAFVAALISGSRRRSALS
jgi:biotin transporter BioY